MGKKDLRNSPILTLAGYYPTQEAYESGLLLPLHAKPSNMAYYRAPVELDDNHFTYQTSSAKATACCFPKGYEGQSSCEFQDYCNQLYTIDGKCECAKTWKKKAGFALPASA